MIDRLMRTGVFRAPENESSAVAEAAAEMPVGSEPEPPADTVPAQSPPGLTADEVYAATQRALADSRKAEEDARAAEAERKAREAQSATHPEMAALDALDLRESMYEEAIALYPDFPPEAKAKLREDLRHFKTRSALAGAKDSKLHLKLADAAAGEAIRTGKYVPSGVATQTVRREPVHSEPTPAIPESYRREMEAEFKSMGLKMTDEDLKQAYEMDRRI